MKAWTSPLATPSSKGISLLFVQCSHFYRLTSTYVGVSLENLLFGESGVDSSTCVLVRGMLCLWIKNYPSQWSSTHTWVEYLGFTSSVATWAISLCPPSLRPIWGTHFRDDNILTLLLNGIHRIPLWYQCLLASFVPPARPFWMMNGLLLPIVAFLPFRTPIRSSQY